MKNNRLVCSEHHCNYHMSSVEMCCIFDREQCSHDSRNYFGGGWGDGRTFHKLAPKPCSRSWKVFVLVELQLASAVQSLSPYF